MWYGFMDRVMLSKKGDSRHPDGKYSTKGNDSGIDHKGVGKLPTQDVIHGAIPGHTFNGGAHNVKPQVNLPVKPAPEPPDHEMDIDEESGRLAALPADLGESWQSLDGSTSGPGIIDHRKLIA